MYGNLFQSEHCRSWPSAFLPLFEGVLDGVRSAGISQGGDVAEFVGATFGDLAQHAAHDGKPRSYLRLGFARCDEGELRTATGRLAKTSKPPRRQ